MTAWIITGACVFILLLLLLIYFNRFVSFRNKVKTAWSDIDVQLKRRYNLIPNLVETVKAYASYERSVLEEITKTRSSAMEAKTPAEQAKAENLLTGSIKGLLVIAESYPQLLANQNFLDLQKNLTDVEENLQMARRYYNAVVRDNNTALQSFPGNIVAGLFGFRTAEFFEIDPMERNPVKV
jgi:LemA protein